MRRPQVGQSLRSRWASWSHQVQKRRFSTAHGRRDSRGRQRQDDAHHLELLARLAVGVDLAGLGLDHDLAARGGGAQAIPRAAGHAPQPTKVPGRCGCSSSTAISCAGRARTSTTRACARRWRAPGTASTCCARSRGPRSSTSSTPWGRGRAARRGSRPLREPVRVTAWRPDIGRLLPVYVADRYEGFEARTLLECSDAEIEAYVEANVDAVRDVCARARPDVALANHLVMGPAIVARGLRRRVPYAVKVHGSALEYVVKRDPERFLPWAREGLARRAHGPRRLAPHGRVAVGGDAGRRPARAHAAGAARRRRRGVPPARRRRPRRRRP